MLHMMVQHVTGQFLLLIMTFRNCMLDPLLQLNSRFTWALERRQLCVMLNDGSRVKPVRWLWLLTGVARIFWERARSSYSEEGLPGFDVFPFPVTLRKAWLGLGNTAVRAHKGISF